MYDNSGKPPAEIAEGGGRLGGSSGGHPEMQQREPPVHREVPEHRESVRMTGAS
jgi:hypothetical protein